MSDDRKVALVTGGNKGIGRAVCKGLAERGYTVLLSGRSEARVARAVEELRGSAGTIEPLVVDVGDVTSMVLAERHVRQTYGRIDVLVNNAGVFLDTSVTKKLERADMEAVRSSLETNALGPLKLCQLFLPMMKEQNYGRIVNVSSTMGQLNDSRPDYVAYRLSKTALNAVTRLVARDIEEYDIKCNSVCPGWVRTDMGGAEANRSPEEGAETIVWAATLTEDGPSGGFFKDREEIPW